MQCSDYIPRPSTRVVEKPFHVRTGSENVPDFLHTVTAFVRVSRVIAVGERANLLSRGSPVMAVKPTNLSPSVVLNSLE